MIRHIESKSILSKLRQKDSYFGIGYNMNLYRGCQHACIYCDTRSSYHGIANITVNKNAVELLKKELHQKRNKKATIGTGSMNDPYMPLEKEIQLTQNALKTISNFKFPVHIITKSDLVIRDLDIIKDISKIYAAVSFTITTCNDQLVKKIELFAPSSSDRFKAIEILAKNGIYTGITLMPLLPFINDTTENIEEIIKRAKDSGASYIIPMFGVTSREFLYRAFNTSFKGMTEKYKLYFGEQYECFSPDYPVLSMIFKEKMEKFGLASRMDFYSPPEKQQLSLF